jgi:hypothetical protein
MENEKKQQQVQRGTYEVKVEWQGPGGIVHISISSPSSSWTQHAYREILIAFSTPAVPPTPSQLGKDYQ